MNDGSNMNDGTRTAIIVALITAVGGVIAALIPIVININAQNSVINVGVAGGAAAATAEVIGADTETISNTGTDNEIGPPESAPPDVEEEAEAPESDDDDGLLFAEDFEGEFDIAEWFVQAYDDSSVEVVDDGTGNHVLQIIGGTPPAYPDASVGSRQWENYVFEVRAQLVDAGNKEDNGSGPPALTAGVRVNYTNDCWTALRIIMDPYNIYSARSGGASEDCQWELYDTFDPYFPALFGRWYDLRIEVFGSLARAYVDGELAQEFTFEGLENGHVSVYARGDSTVYYDDFRVTELTTP